MNGLLRSIAFLLIEELVLCFIRLRINWKKLLFAGAIMTVSVIVLLTRFISEPSEPTASLLPIIPQNASIQVIQSMPIVIETTGVSQMQRMKVDDEFKVISISPPRNTDNESDPLPGETDDKFQVTPSSPPRKIDDEFNPTPIKTYDKFKVTSSSPPLVETHSPLQRYISKLTTGEALLFAKKEIEHAPIITRDPDLYAPVFRNLSIFKRSYELMEMTLKVYIYHEGKRPIFHQPHMKGIYASEGWFMKLMKGNKQFVTIDPKKAHLFYLPYSVRQLELTLYKNNSHDLRPLSEFLRDYVNMIAAKYPFWNLTHGSDHFMVACHDWGPYTTAAHKELKEKTIKALCNADTSEGYFVVGKDVSLPETTIRNPRKPLKDIGGRAKLSQRPILAFFAGGMHGRVRPKLVQYWRDKEKDMKIYKRLPRHVSQNMSYVKHMKSSKFCLCPMGYEVNSPRIIESIYYECVPVIIADNFVLPLSEVLDWSAFSLVVPEKDIPNLREILLAVPVKRYLKMLFNVKMVQKHFLWHNPPVKHDLFHMILHSIWFNRLNQIEDPYS